MHKEINSPHLSWLNVMSRKVLSTILVWKKVMGYWSKYQPAFSVFLPLQDLSLSLLVYYTFWLQRELRLLTVKNSDSN